MSLDRQLKHLETVGLIRVARLYPELEYLFQRALPAVQEVLGGASRGSIQRAPPDGLR